ncbi:MAG: hypothetical protein WBM86_23200 [Waterburya sp.]
MAIVGYARVSSVGQSLDVQLDKLQHCDKTYQENKVGRIKSVLNYKLVWNMSEKEILWW